MPAPGEVHEVEVEVSLTGEGAMVARGERNAHGSVGRLSRGR